MIREAISATTGAIISLAEYAYRRKPDRLRARARRLETRSERAWGRGLKAYEKGRVRAGNDLHARSRVLSLRAVRLVEEAQRLEGRGR